MSSSSLPSPKSDSSASVSDTSSRAHHKGAYTSSRLSSLTASQGSETTSRDAADAADDMTAGVGRPFASLSMEPTATDVHDLELDEIRQDRYWKAMSASSRAAAGAITASSKNMLLTRRSAKASVCSSVKSFFRNLSVKHEVIIAQQCPQTSCTAFTAPAESTTAEALVRRGLFRRWRRVSLSLKTGVVYKSENGFTAPFFALTDISRVTEPSAAPSAATSSSSPSRVHLCVYTTRRRRPFRLAFPPTGPHMTLVDILRTFSP